MFAPETRTKFFLIVLGLLALSTRAEAEARRRGAGRARIKTGHYEDTNRAGKSR